MGSYQNGVVYLNAGTHPEFKCPKDRYKTFKGINFINVSKALLAQAGFYYQADRQRPKATTCFHCGVVIDTWSLGDNDPFVKHAQANAACTYLRLVAPRELIAEQDQAAERQHTTLSRGSVQAFITKALLSEAMANCGRELAIPVLKRIIFLRDLRSTDDSPSQLQTAPTFHEVESAINELENNEKLLDFFDDSEHNDLDALDDQPTEYSEDDIGRMAKDNADLKSRIMCRECNERESNILHTPCGHNVYCAPCSAGMINCAYSSCNETITGRVVTTLVGLNQLWA